jgi:prepilin-type N-terminal cleavage/methylation domain-containing protein
MSNKGFTLIELIATLLIISVITVIVIPKIINFEGNAEKRLLLAVLDEMNAREHMAFLDCKMTENCVDYNMPNFSDLHGATLVNGNTISFAGGGSYQVYRNETPYAFRWTDKLLDSVDPPEITPPSDQCPDGYSKDKHGKCKKDKKK